jgi:transposase
MDAARKQRGLEIAATKKITQAGDTWTVPSQSGNGKYTVRPKAEKPYCSCPDHESHRGMCKHLFAVEFVIQRELFPDGTETVTQTVTVTETIKKPTYKQDWPNYNLAQVNEKDKFLSLLYDLCRKVKSPTQENGRPRLPLSDAIFAACFKVYSTISGRRFMSDLRAAQEKGYIAKAPHFNTIFNTLESEEVFPVLRSLIAESALPLKAVEVDFAVDSSGFSACRFVKWHDEKYGKERSGRDWVKAHICTGVKTNIVTSVEIHERDAADSPLFGPLVKATAASFKVKEVSGDKAYCSLENHEIVGDVGGTPFLAFKLNATGSVGGLYQKMFHYFCFRQEEFQAHYHKRSNVESTFSMMKAKFRDSVRSKGGIAAKNEVLCKILCHNICCLISAMYELNIEPTFWTKSEEKPVAQKVASCT